MIPANKGKRLPPEALTAEEIESVIGKLGGGPAALRNEVVILLMWRAGLRSAEALSVRRCDLTMDGGRAVVRVVSPKGAGRGVLPRVLGLGAMSTSRLKPWLEVFERRGWPHTTPLCCTLQGKPMATGYLRQFIPRAARRAGITRRVHPHAFRHTFAFESVMEGQPLPWVSRALGHTSMLTTQRYLDHLAPADVISGMQGRD